MIDHFGINCVDYARSQRFYDRVLGLLGYSRQLDLSEAIGYGRDGTPTFWISQAPPGAAVGPNRETHFAFAAADHDAVRAFHDAAVELGAE
jgi:catechol 2,3-dioxygenase-like lactoylglutathione lyase family enzyme